MDKQEWLHLEAKQKMLYAASTIESILDEGIHFETTQVEGGQKFVAFDCLTDSDIIGYSNEAFYDASTEEWKQGFICIHIDGTVYRTLYDNDIRDTHEDAFLKVVAGRILEYRQRVLKKL